MIQADNATEDESEITKATLCCWVLLPSCALFTGEICSYGSSVSLNVDLYADNKVFKRCVITVEVSTKLCDLIHPLRKAWPSVDFYLHKVRLYALA